MARPRRSVILAAAVFALVVSACSTSATTFPPVGFTPAPAGASTAAARAAVAAALATEGLQVVDSLVAYRPGEGSQFAAAPRNVIQVTLPDDPSHGYIVLYALPSPAAALAAATDQAAYIASGIGRVQFATDAEFTLRVFGSTAVFFWWSPANSPDQRTPEIQLALSQVGTEVPIPG